MKPLRAIRFLWLLPAVTWCTSGHAQSGSLISGSIAKELGAGYAAMINFAENPDIATAHYYIDDATAGDPILRVTRLSWGHEFKSENHAWTPTILLVTPYLRLNASYDLGTNGGIDTQWSALGAVLMTGVKTPLTERLSITPSLAWGYVRLDNTADYSGNSVLLEPFLKGVILDWTSDAWVFGGSIGADYERMIGKRNLLIHASAAHNLVETFKSVQGRVEFSSYATTLTLRGEMAHPTSLRLKGDPVSVVTIIGGTGFAGPYRDELGFSYFMDAGLALEVDLAERDWIIRNLRLGAKGIYGEDVIGWSAILSWKF